MRRFTLVKMNVAETVIYFRTVMTCIGRLVLSVWSVPSLVTCLPIPLWWAPERKFDLTAQTCRLVWLFPWHMLSLDNRSPGSPMGKLLTFWSSGPGFDSPEGGDLFFSFLHRNQGLLHKVSHRSDMIEMLLKWTLNLFRLMGYNQTCNDALVNHELFRLHRKQVQCFSSNSSFSLHPHISSILVPYFIVDKIV